MEADTISGNLGLNPANVMARMRDLPPQDQLQEVSRQFEAIFVRQFLDESLKPMIKGFLGEESASSGIYQQFMVGSLADGITHGGGFGISNSIQLQLQKASPGKGVAQ